MDENILEPNFNSLPPVNDWEKVFVALQQANEKGFRGSSLQELGKRIVGDVAIQGADFEDLPIATSAAPVALPVPEAEMKFGFLANGTYTQTNGPDLVYTDVQWGLTLFDGTRWVKKFTLTIPKGKDGKDGINGTDGASLLELWSATSPNYPYKVNVQVRNAEGDTYVSLVGNNTFPLTDSTKWKSTGGGGLFEYDVDVSEISNNYNLTLAEAINLVPQSYRKRLLKIRFNNTEVFQFLGVYSVANWDKINFWLRPSNALREGKLNLFDARMIYRGFNFQTSGVINYHPDNSCIIVPVHQVFDESGVQINTVISSEIALLNLGINGSGLLTETLTGSTTLVGYTYSGKPTAVQKYVYINISHNNGTTTLGLSQLNNLLDYVFYKRQGYENLRVAELNEDIYKLIPTPAEQAFDVVQKGNRIIPKFKCFSPLSKIGTRWIEEFINSVKITAFSADIPVLNKATGKPRRMYLHYLTTSVNGATVRINIEDAVLADVYESVQMFTYGGNQPTFLNNELWQARGLSKEKIEIIIKIRTSVIGLGHLSTSLTIEQAKLNEDLLVEMYNTDKNNLSEVIDDFTDFSSTTITNYNTNNAVTDLQVKRGSNRGKKYYILKDAANIWHGQMMLTGDKFTNMQGLKRVLATLSVDSSVTEGLSLVTATSSYSGVSPIHKAPNNQWIHPDIAYCGESGVGGWKYWMVSSIYPFAQPAFEDAELFVSHDGVNWERIPSVLETGLVSPVTLRVPASGFTGVPETRNKTFMPIPAIGEAVEFQTDLGIVNTTVKWALNHDPAILFHNGYIHIYVTYNFGLTNTTQRDKYRVCYRTNDGVNWEIVRSDGSTMPLTTANSKLVFTSTGGVRNHIQYINFDDGKGGTSDACPQIVKVSENEFYLYVKDDTNYNSPITGLKTGIARYKGTTPYSFSTVPEIISIDKAVPDRIWHFGFRYLNGKYYFLHGGFLCESADGINFKQPANPLYSYPATSDLYKPTFDLGGDGKLKICQSLQVHLTFPASFANKLNASQNVAQPIITQMVSGEFSSLASALSRQVTPVKDAWVDLIFATMNSRFNEIRFSFLPNLKDKHSIPNVLVQHGDTICVTAFMNVRNNGSVTFENVIID